MIKFFDNIKHTKIQITTEMIHYRLENSDEKIQISSFEELWKKDFWNDIVYLDCSRNEIKNLDNLPPNLQILHCGNNSIKYISKFPDSIKIEKELISEYEMRKNMDYGIIKDDDIEGYLPNDYVMKIKNLIDEGMIWKRYEKREFKKKQTLE